MANGAAPYGAAITFLFFGGYKAVVPTGPMTDYRLLPIRGSVPYSIFGPGGTAAL
jgi:hypothetical protein